MRNTSFPQQKQETILLMVTLLLLIFGITMIYSSSSIMAAAKYGDGFYFVKRQLAYVVLGLFCMMVLRKISYEKCDKFACLGLLVSAVCLVLLFVPHLGIRVNNATRWLKIGVVTFQVVEVVKVAIVIFLAHYLSKKNIAPEDFVKGFLVPLGITLAIMGLILQQPDFGSTVIIGTIMFFMLFLAGTRIRYLAGLMALLLPAAMWQIVHSAYRWERFKTMLNPWSDPLGTGFQIIQSFISFGSGGPFGVGLGDGMQKLYYLPEPHTDFILSVIAEEGGFVAVAIVITLFVIFVLRGFIIAYKAPDFFGTLLASGLTMTIAVEAIINIAGVMGLIPVKGLALPFVSYGGSSVVMSLVAVGILLNISAHR